jgi:hypothetical protein
VRAFGFEVGALQPLENSWLWAWVMRVANVGRVGGGRGACRILMVEPEEKRFTEGSRRRWEDNTKMDLR